MSVHRANGRLLVLLSLLVAIILQIMPYPIMVQPWRPDWLVLVAVYWALALPHRYNIFTAWILGLLLDVLLGGTLGIHALALAFVVYIVGLHFQKIRTFSVWQHSLIIVFFVCIYHLIVFSLEFVVNGATFSITLLYPAVSSLIIWPWLFWILRRTRRQYKVR